MNTKTVSDLKLPIVCYVSDFDRDRLVDAITRDAGHLLPHAGGLISSGTGLIFTKLASHLWATESGRPRTPDTYLALGIGPQGGGHLCEMLGEQPPMPAAKPGVYASQEFSAFLHGDPGRPSKESGPTITPEQARAAADTSAFFKAALGKPFVEAKLKPGEDEQLRDMLREAKPEPRRMTFERERVPLGGLFESRAADTLYGLRLERIEAKLDKLLDLLTPYPGPIAIPTAEDIKTYGTR